MGNTGDVLTKYEIEKYGLIIHLTEAKTYEPIDSDKIQATTYDLSVGEFHFDIDENVALTLHGSDTRQEYIYLKNILLSINNLFHIEKRIYQTYRATFLEWIEDFKAVCKENDIPIENTCIAGSSPLEVVGIRQSTDIDFTVTGNSGTIFPNNFLIKMKCP